MNANDPYSVLEDLPFCLVRAAMAFRKLNDRSLRAVGLQSLAPGIASVLHAVEELTQCTVNQLVEKTRLPNGTLTGLLDTLERDGYLQRTRHPVDGRSRIIHLTENGHHICDKLHQRHALVMEMLKRELSEAEVSELTRLLGKFTDCIQSCSFEPPSNPDNQQ